MPEQEANIKAEAEEPAVQDPPPQDEPEVTIRLRRRRKHRFNPLGRLDRYLLRTFVPALVVALFVVCGLYMVGGILNRLDELRDMGVMVALPKVLLFYALLLAMIAPSLLPAVTLVAAGLTVVRLSRANEILSMVAAGISLKRVFAPLFAASLLVSTACALYFEWPMPEVAGMLELLETELGREGVRDVVVEDEKNRLVFVAGEFRPRQHYMERVFVLGRNEQGEREFTMHADKAMWTGAHELRLERVVEHRFNPDGAPAGPGRAFADIRLPVSFPPEQFLKGNDIRPHRLRFEELKQYAENEGNIPIYTVALHSRLCQPFAGLVLFTMGLPLLVGFQTLSRSHFISTGLCVLVAGGFYLLTFTCQNLGNSGVLDPVWSAWLPTVLCAAVGLLLTDSMHT